MDFHDSTAERAFRSEVATFLDAEFPAEMSQRPTEWGLFNGA